MKPIDILDCHQHLVYPDRLGYAWTAGIPDLAGRAFTLEDYRRQVEPYGPVRAIFMETAVDDADIAAEADWVRALTEQADTPIDGMILTCRPESETGFVDWLDTVRHPRLVGFRRILHTEDDALALRPTFAANIRRLGPRQLTFDLCVLARQLPTACRLVDQCPEVRFVLDHCGIPDVAGQVLDPWRQDLAELARRPNVHCKISGLLAYADPADATAAAVRPFFETAIETFGWDRVVWGSDWPVVCLTSSLPGWIDITLELLAGESHQNRDRLLHRNARRLYLRQD